MDIDINERPDKVEYYLGIAKAVSERSTCLSKHYGAVIVKNDIIVSTGYNGAPRGRLNCCDVGKCIRKEAGVPRGYDYATSCRSVHAEMNAIIAASYDQMNGASLYLYGWDCKKNSIVEGIDCCPICKRLIINAGIKYAFFSFFDPKDTIHAYIRRDIRDWIDEDTSLTTLGGY